MTGHARRRFIVSCAKMAEPIFAVWVVESSVPKEAQVQSYSPAQCALMRGHIGASQRIRLNRPSASALRSYVKLL